MEILRATDKRRSSKVKYPADLAKKISLEFGDFGEMEIANFHRRDDHVETFFTGRANGRAQHLDVGQRRDDALIESEITNAACNFAILDQERAVAGHAGDHFFVRLNFTDVPEARH